MDFDLKLTGFKELAEALRELPKDISRNALRSAVGAGAAVIRKETKKNALAMKDTGTLARSIYQKQIREKSDAEKQTFYVGARQGKKYQRVGKKQVSQDAYYARFVEFGHFTRRIKGDLAVSLSAGTHWVPPHPFLRPAFDVTKEQAIEAIRMRILERIEKYRAR